MSDDSAGDSSAVVERVFRESYGSALATLVRVFGDISLAEDAVSEAFAVASTRWPEHGVPPNPGGWIVTTARNKAIDVLRRSARGAELLADVAVLERHDERDVDLTVVEDDQLRLIFTCCHPSIRQEDQVALTLRLLGGLTEKEVAGAFLVSESAMAKRLVRAKHKIKATKVPYRVPTDTELPARLRPVLAAVYLIYNAGADDRDRNALRTEALRLAQSLRALMPDEPEVAGLLALLLLNESRMPARLAGQDVVLLRDQDRELWDQSLIEEGHAIVRACIERGQPGPYQLQAAIQALHCDAKSFAATDWAQIVLLYDQLVVMSPTPVVALNRAIAVGETDGPDTALGLLEAVGADLARYHLYHATRASFLERLGREVEAAAAYENARSLASRPADRQFLEERLNSLSR